MKLATSAFAAILLAGSVPLFAGAAAAGPTNQASALTNAAPATIQQVQHRRWRGGRGHRGRWIGPAAGFAAGVAVGSALGPRYYGDAYDAYAAAPGYYCTGDRYNDSGNPSWACPDNGAYPW